MKFALLLPAVIAIVFGIPIALNGRGVAIAAASRFHWSRSPFAGSAVAWRLVGGFLVVFGITWALQVITGITHG